jgi:hypothetical protein
MRKWQICVSSMVMVVLFNQVGLGELSTLSKEDFVDLLQIQEAKVRAYSFDYRLSHGEYKETGKFVPSLQIDCEYSHNLDNGHSFLREIWLNKDLERLYAYNGKLGTKLTLKQPGDPTNKYGTIMSSAPQELIDQAIWKPGFFSYGMIPRPTLSKALRDAFDLNFDTVNLNKELVYRIDFRLKGKYIKNSAKKGLREVDRYVVYISPSKGMRAIKIDQLSNGEGKVFSSCTVSQFREVLPGTWVPCHLERGTIFRTAKRLIDIDTIAINDDVSVHYLIKFPPGTYVKDEMTGNEYQVTREKDR